MVNLHPVIQQVADDGMHHFWVLPEPSQDGHSYAIADNFVLHPYAWQARSQGDPAKVGGKEFAFLLNRNIAENDCEGKPDYAEVWGREAGKTCIFLSPGPSLRDSLPEIKEKAQDRDRYFTLGLNRALTALPDIDYLVVTDHNCQPDWWKGPEKNTKTILIAGNQTAPHVPKWFEKVYWYEGMRSMDSGHTIGCMRLGITACDALMAAYKLGARRILLYGCDFAIAGEVQNGKHMATLFYHDRRVEQELPKRSREYYGIPTPFNGAGDKIVGVTYEMQAHASRFQAVCMMLETGGVKIENCTPVGIFAYAREPGHVPCHAEPVNTVNKIVFVSFYTPNYADQAARLKRSLDKWEVKYDIQAIEPKPEGWLGAVRFKPRFMRDMLDKHKDAAAIVWLDADSECIRYPYLFWALPWRDPAPAFAAHILNDKELISSALYWANSPEARKALDVWIDSCDRMPGHWEQRILQGILPALECTVGSFCEEFCWIAEPLPGQCQKRRPGQWPVILQHQASREVRAGKR